MNAPQKEKPDAGETRSLPVVSMVESAAQTNTSDVQARSVIGHIRLGTWRKNVVQIRRTFNDTREKTGDRKTAKRSVDRAKKNLPAILWSGRFSRRANDALIEHSGLLCADLDDLGQNLPNVRAKLLKSLHLRALFLSPTGDGLKAIFNVPADPTKHSASFQSVQQHVMELTGVQIDEACKDVARLCFVSFDPGLYFNPNAVELVPLVEAEEKNTPVALQVCAPNLKMRQRVALELLGQVEWTCDTRGYCICPGKRLHTSGDGARDCEIHLDGAPTLHCFHNSCTGVLHKLNHELRSQIGRAELAYERTSEQRGRYGKVSLTPSKWFSKSFPLLTDEYGNAVLEKVDENGKLIARSIGEDFLAATLGEKGSPNSPTVFLPTEEKFYTYDLSEGVFVHQREPAYLMKLSRLLLTCARDCRHECDTSALEFRLRNSATLCGVLRKARGLLAVKTDFFSTDLTNFIPCSNGILGLKDKSILPFSHAYHRRNKLAVAFDPSARCPLFLETLMRPALDEDELDFTATVVWTSTYR